MIVHDYRKTEKQGLAYVKDLPALTFVGPTRNNPVLDPLAVLHLNNHLYISINFKLIFFLFSVQSIFTVPGIHLSKDPGYRSSAFPQSSGKSRRQSMLLWLNEQKFDQNVSTKSNGNVNIIR